MVPTAPAEVWSVALEYIRAHTKPQQFDTWFRAVECVSIDDDEVVLGTPNAFFMKWMTNHYATLIEQALTEVAGPRRLRFIVSGSDGAEEGLDGDEGLPAEAPPAFAATATGGASFSGAGAPPAAGLPLTGLAPPPWSHATAPAPAAISYREGPPRGDDEIKLNSEYTFDNFVVGHSNRLAHAACLAITESLASVYNPLFLHGGVGLGKTHLLQAVCSTLKKKQPQIRLVYLACEAFVNQYIAALQRGQAQVESFRGRYRHVDLLVIDDIHFLSSKKQLQEEFFHTFNALYNGQRQIILSSDAPPHEIPELENRLVSRFKWGLVAEVEPPGYETKCAIIKRKAKARSRDLPQEVVDYLANALDSNIRELEGAVLKVCALSGVENRPIDVSLCRTALKEIAARPGQVQITDIMAKVSAHFGVKVSDLQSKRRSKSVVLPRQVCMYLGRELTKLSLEELGGYFGGRDHTTVLYGEKRIRELVATDPEFRQLIDRLTRELTRAS